MSCAWKRTTDDDSLEAKVVRELRRVNGKPPREKDKKDRAGCTGRESAVDRTAGVSAAGPPVRVHVRVGRTRKGKDRNSLILDFTSTEAGRQGRTRRGSAWTCGLLHLVAAGCREGTRLDRRVELPGAAGRTAHGRDGRPPRVEKDPARAQPRQQRRSWSGTTRPSATRRSPFHDPDEAMILPESIDTLDRRPRRPRVDAQPPDLHRLPAVPHRRAGRANLRF